MRKDCTKRAPEGQNYFGCCCSQEKGPIVTRNSRKSSKQIHKKKTKKTRKQRIPRVASHQGTSSQKNLSSKQIQKSTEAHLTRVFPTRSTSFELQTLVPSTSQEEVSEELKQVWTYVSEIGEHLLELEAKFPRPHINYSNYFGPSQRVRCVTLMSSFCAKFGFKLETQSLAFEIFHRICTAPDFQRYHSALKAAACLYVAAKYEEVCAPQARLFSLLDPLQQVAPENIIKLEGMILIHLNFNLGLALPVHFAELLALRYGLEKDSRTALLQLCLQGVVSEQLWMGGGSLLAMACMCMVSDSVLNWQRTLIEEELRWRVALLEEMIGQ